MPVMPRLSKKRVCRQNSRVLKLVPPAEPSLKQAVLERVKAAKRPDGLWQCPRCGCRTSLSTESGAMTIKGRKRAGTVIDKDVCSECWKQGIDSPMRPQIKRVT